MGDLEHTFAMVKPDAIGHVDEIINLAEKAGFTVVQKRRVLLKPEQTSEFYAEHYGKVFFTSLVTFMSSGPVMALVLAKENAIAGWRALIGPTDSEKARETVPNSIRALFGANGSQNAVHGSDSAASARREIRFFFPDVIVEPLLDDRTTREYLEQKVNPTLVRGLTALCKAKPDAPVSWLADWLLENNPATPNVLEPED